MRSRFLKSPDSNSTVNTSHVTKEAKIVRSKLLISSLPMHHFSLSTLLPTAFIIVLSTGLVLCDENHKSNSYICTAWNRMNCLSCLSNLDRRAFELYMHGIVELNRSLRFSLSASEMTLCYTKVLVSN